MENNSYSKLIMEEFMNDKKLKKVSYTSLFFGIAFIAISLFLLNQF